MSKKLDTSHYHVERWVSVVVSAIYIAGGLGVIYRDWDVGLFFVGIGAIGVLVNFTAMVHGEK